MTRIDDYGYYGPPLSGTLIRNMLSVQNTYLIRRSERYETVRLGLSMRLHNTFLSAYLVDIDPFRNVRASRDS